MDPQEYIEALAPEHDELFLELVRLVAAGGVTLQIIASMEAPRWQREKAVSAVRETMLGFAVLAIPEDTDFKEVVRHADAVMELAKTVTDEAEAAVDLASMPPAGHA